MTTRSGIFTQQEFEGRNVLKLAPDAFITINGSLGARIVSPATMKGTQDLEVRGGVTSITVNAAIKPAGATRATIEIIAPQYKGLHEDYYVTLPNGTRIPYFIPMMEVKIFMKGLYLDRKTKRTKYYPVFWGLITEVTENYSGGNFTFSISCQDVLNWWKHQMITLRPISGSSGKYGAPVAARFPTVFERLNAFEVIVSLFMDDFFIDKNGKRYDFIYAKLGHYIPPDFTGIKDGKVDDTMGGLAKDVVKYWDGRFGFNLEDKEGNPKIPFEMYGLKSPISSDNIKSIVKQITEYRVEERAVKRSDTKVVNSNSVRKSDMTSSLDLDFGILARVQPFGSTDLYGNSSEALVHSKLDIVNDVCEQVQMEFFVDTNGTIVFKPPFYNLNVIDTSLKYYMISPKDIIDFNASINSDNIINYLEVTSPQNYLNPGSQELLGYHMDWDSILQFGLKTKSMALRYGNSAESLRLLAAAEMAKINATAYTGSVSIPLRPEIRLGYPVYIEHIDAFYYVTGVSHSLTFGTSATTSLSLESRRDRIFSDGSVPNTKVGDVLKGYVYRFKAGSFKSDVSAVQKYPLEKIAELEESLKASFNDVNVEAIQNELEKLKIMTQNKTLSGPKFLGAYEISKVEITGDVIRIGDTPEQILNKVTSNELLMMTDDTIPYTDIDGYKHIGAFPYGANMRMSTDTTMKDKTDPNDPSSYAAEAQSGSSSSTNNTPVDTPSPSASSKNKEPTAEELKEDAKQHNQIIDNVKNLYSSEFAVPDVTSTEDSVRTQLRVTKENQEKIPPKKAELRASTGPRR